MRSLCSTACSTAFFSLLTLGLVLSSCAPAMLPNTDVFDNAQNRRIVNLVESYRRAMEDSDTATLKNMMSKRYYENASTTDTTEDDWGYKDSEVALGRLNDQILAINYDIHIKRIEVYGTRADVFFDYTWNFQFTDGKQERWAKNSDTNRLELIQEDGGWKILSGM